MNIMSYLHNALLKYFIRVRIGQLESKCLIDSFFFCLHILHIVQLVGWFYGILTIAGYLMPNRTYTRILNTYVNVFSRQHF